MVKKVLFFDIDGTLLNSELKIPEGVKKELKRLNTIVDSSKEEGDWLSSNKATVADLFTAINCVRPDTFENTKDLDAFLDNKYYTIKDLADEQNWSEYIY